MLTFLSALQLASAAPVDAPRPEVVVGLVGQRASRTASDRDLSAGITVGWRPVRRFTAELQAVMVRQVGDLERGMLVDRDDRRDQTAFLAVYSPLLGRVGWTGEQPDDGAHFALDLGVGAGPMSRQVVTVASNGDVVLVGVGRNARLAGVATLGPRIAAGAFEARLRTTASVWDGGTVASAEDVAANPLRVRLDLGLTVAVRLGTTAPGRGAKPAGPPDRS